MIEREELERLVAANAAPLYRYCLFKLGGNEALAEQTVSDVWLVLLKKQKTLRGGRDMRAFLYRTADRCANHNIESAKRRNMNIAPLEEWCAAEGASSDEYFKDERGEEELARSLEEKISPELKDIFRMRFIEKTDLADIARATGLPYSTVRYRIEMIRREVKALVADGEIGNHEG